MAGAPGGKGTGVLTLWDYALALLVLSAVGGLVWLIAGPSDITALPADLVGLDDVPDAAADAGSGAGDRGPDRLSA